MFKRTHYLALGSVLLLTLIVLNLSSGPVARFKLAISGLFLPFFGLADSSQQLAGKTAGALTPKGELLRQNGELRRENEELRVRLMQTQQAVRENDRLRQLIGWQKQTPWKLRLANVVLRDPANWWRTVQIDLGSAHGVRENLPVLTPDGLVGRVSAVGLTRSQVVLLGDASCRVSALVENEAHDTGIIQAVSDPIDPSLVDLSYLSRNAVLSPGQNVMTSGLGGTYPKGIPIGKIVDSRPVEFGLYTEARVKLTANLSALEEVWVLFP